MQKAFNLTLDLFYKDIPDVKNILSKKVIKLHWHWAKIYLFSSSDYTKIILKHKHILGIENVA